MQENQEELVADIDEEHAEQLEVMEKAVHDSIASDDLITKNAAKHIKPDTLLDKISDAVTKFSGSYYFILGLTSFIALWMLFMPKRVDEYPWILLNLIISVVCVLQSPFILKGAWRKEEKDRDQASQDFAINLKNEMQINHLLDHQEELLELVRKQQAILVELQVKQTVVKEEK